MEGKVCTKCKEEKSFEEFYKDKQKKDGLCCSCKTCIKEFRQQNEDDIRKQSKKYYQKNYEKIREKRKDYFAEYRKNNRKLLREKGKEYRQTERGKETNYRKKLKRRSYKANVEFKPHKRKEILKRNNWTCQYCGIKVHDKRSGNWNTPDKAHIDHIIPISKGGNSELSNLQVLCRTCNLSKSDKVVI